MEEEHHCSGDCGDTFHCDHCHRDVGVCMGAYDDIERKYGPICDDCAPPFAALIDSGVQS